MSPDRIQRKRTAGWKAPEGAIYVGRGTIFGNPFTVEDAIAEGFAEFESAARFACVVAHRDWLAGDRDYQDRYTVSTRTYDRYEVAGALLTLVGHDLMCWCPLPTRGRADVCHAATLLVLAAGLVPS